MLESPRGITWGRRISNAALTVILNVIVWILIPFVLSSRLSGLALPGFTSTFVLTFGIIVTMLQAGGALTEGMGLSVPFNSGSYIASAYYIFAATNGGILNVAERGLTIELDFQLIVGLMMLASLFNAVRIPITYLLEQTEASRGTSFEF
jgi:hypothetical protein